MTEEAKRLLEELRKLATQDRADIAAALLADLDGEPDEEVEKAWAAEIERRAKAALSGESAGIPWPQVEDEIRRKLSKA